MRNLKRALSLTLASVMLLGMMVVGSSAAKGYDDVSETDNVEAIEVLQAIEVMVGDDRGFGPERPVNRAEMAVVMGKLLSLDYNYYSATCPFNDVYDWARGWVGACAANGIVSGRGDGVYDPGATVTAVEAASMLMRALGYFKYQNDYQDGFEVSTVRQGTTIGIFDGVGSSATEPMTRNQVAQMVLNALQSAVVEPDGRTVNLTTPDGTVLTGKVNYVSVTSAKPFATSISTVRATSVGSQNDGWIVELGERLYDGKLRLNDNTVDVFGRPSRQWEFDGKDVGTYIKKELLRQEWTVKVTGRMFNELLTKPTIDDYDFTITIDGETERGILNNYGYFTKENMIRSNTETVGATGNGVLTQVFVDSDKKEVYVAIINTYLAKAIDDYNDKKEEVDFDVWSVRDVDGTSNIVLVKDKPAAGAAKISEKLTVKNEDISVEDVKADDIVLVRVAEGEIQEIVDPEVVDSTTISAFKNGDWVNADGTQYDYANTIQYDTEVLDQYDDKNMKETTYRVYLDKYGYAIGIEIIEEADKYVFLTGIDQSTSNLYNKTADGNVIHLDGTMSTVKINMDKSRNAYNQKFSVGNTAPTDYTNGTKTYVNSLMNTWCTYSVDANGVYTLTEVANTARSFYTRFNNDSITAYNTTGRQNDKVGQGRNYGTDRATGETNYTAILDKAHITLNGIPTQTSGDGLTGTNTYKSDFKRVYANDDTVFLGAETELITATNRKNGDKAPSVIISGVDNVATGIQDVNMKAYTAAALVASENYTGVAGTDNDTSHGVYTLFKDNGYVIAAVVIGEDDGTTSNYAYVTSSNMKQEAYSSADDEYTWTREVIVDGVITDLTEKGDSNPEIGNNNMVRGEWYEVKYKADGTVRKVTLISRNDAIDGSVGSHKNSTMHIDNAKDFVFCADKANHIGAGTSNYPKFIGRIEYVEPSYDDGNDTIVLYEDLNAQPYKVSVRGRSLMVDNTTDNVSRGFAVTSDAKTVLIQDVQPKDSAGNPVGGLKVMDRKFEYEGGTTGLERAVKQMNDNNNFKGYIGAVIKNGVATSIIIWDRTETGINTGDWNGSNSGTLTVVRNGLSLIVRYSGDTAPDLDACIAAIQAYLTGQGWTIEDMYQSVGTGINFQVSRTSNSGLVTRYTFTWGATGSDIEQMIKLTVNGREVSAPSSATYGELAKELNVKAGKWVKKTVKDGTESYEDATSSSDVDFKALATAGTKIEFGYYKVTAETTDKIKTTADPAAEINAKITALEGHASNPVYVNGAKTVELTITGQSGGISGNGYKLAVKNAGFNIVGSDVMAGLAADATMKVKVSVPANIADDAKIVLTATAIEDANVQYVVNGKPVKPEEVTETTTWNQLANSTGVSTSKRGLYVLDETTGEYIDINDVAAPVNGHRYSFGYMNKNGVTVDNVNSLVEAAANGVMNTETFLNVLKNGDDSDKELYAILLPEDGTPKFSSKVKMDIKGTEVTLSGEHSTSVAGGETWSGNPWYYDASKTPANSLLVMIAFPAPKGAEGYRLGGNYYSLVKPDGSLVKDGTVAGILVPIGEADENGVRKAGTASVTLEWFASVKNDKTTQSGVITAADVEGTMGSPITYHIDGAGVTIKTAAPAPTPAA